MHDGNFTGIKLNIGHRLDIGHVRGQHRELFGWNFFYKLTPFNPGLLHPRNIKESDLVQDG